MSAPAKCYVCGSRAIAATADPRSPTCEDCVAARQHVVSMQTAPDGGSLAVCECGWRSKVAGKARYMIQDVKVRLHWREVIKRSRTLCSVIALMDSYAAALAMNRAEVIRDGLFGLAAIAVVALDLVALAVVTGGAR